MTFSLRCAAAGLALLAFGAVGCNEIKEIGVEAVETVIEDQKVRIGDELEERGRDVADQQREKLWSGVDSVASEGEGTAPANKTDPADGAE